MNASWMLTMVVTGDDDKAKKLADVVSAHMETVVSTIDDIEDTGLHVWLSDPVRITP